MTHSMTRLLLLAFFAAASAGCLDSIVGSDCDPAHPACSDSDPGSPGPGTMSPPVQGFEVGPDGGDAGPGPDSGPEPDPDAGPEPEPEPGLVCLEGETACGDTCVLTASDPFNCGGCGVTCDSGLCEEGVCQDAASGHLVLIGHDYSSSHAGLDRLLGNAVFLPVRAEVQILVYRGDASESALARVDAAIEDHAGATGRDWQRVSTSDPTVAAEILPLFDVLLVHHQVGADGDGLAAMGAAWAEAVPAFARDGGVVIVLDGGGDAGGTHLVLEQGGLFDPAAVTDVAGQAVDVTAPADAIASGVPLRYLAPSRSVSFGTDPASTGATAVVTAGSGEPVVVHLPVH